MLTGPAGFQGGPPATGLVQQATGESAGTSVTLAFDQVTTPGNSVIVVVAGAPLRTITGIILGNTGGLFSYQGGGPGGGAWAAYQAEVGAGAVTITAGDPGISATATEVSGPVSGIEWQADAFPAGGPHFVAGVCTGTFTGPPLGGVVEVLVS